MKKRDKDRRRFKRPTEDRRSKPKAEKLTSVHWFGGVVTFAVLIVLAGYLSIVLK